MDLPRQSITAIHWEYTVKHVLNKSFNIMSHTNRERRWLSHKRNDVVQEGIVEKIIFRRYLG